MRVSRREDSTGDVGAKWTRIKIPIISSSCSHLHSEVSHVFTCTRFNPPLYRASEDRAGRILAATHTGNICPEHLIPARRKQPVMQPVLQWPEKPQEHKPPRCHKTQEHDIMRGLTSLWRCIPCIQLILAMQSDVESRAAASALH